MQYRVMFEFIVGFRQSENFKGSCVLVDRKKRVF